tara:strand:+ start:181 stop:873 length:693 start_codon:yes stop_codon:yes gene_type:complete
MKNFKDNLNITKLKPGSWRSMLGYAGQEIALGRLLSCGFNVARSLWRDGKYDGALDVNNVMIKIEIKSSTTTNYSVTSGQRGGLSIRKEVKSGEESREEILKKDDADFLVGVSLLDGTCCIVPIEIVSICKRKSLPIKSLEIYKEKFKIFLGFKKFGITTENIKYGFSHKDIPELEEIIDKLKITKSNLKKEDNFNYPKEKILKSISKNIKTDYKNSLILDIWSFLYRSI